jgi:hypothetical protein
VLARCFVEAAATPISVKNPNVSESIQSRLLIAQPISTELIAALFSLTVEEV